MAEEKEKKIKDIFEMGGETSSFFERVAKEAGYEGYGRLAEVKESELKSLFSKIKEKLKGKAKEIKEKPQVPLILRILLPFLIVFQAFFPGMIFGMTITFVIILIVIIIVIALIAYFTGGTALAAPGASGLIMNIIIPIATITILFVIVNFIGSPNYSKVAGKIPNGSLIVDILLVISGGFAGLTAWKGKSYTSFIAGSGGLIAFLFFIMPFGISYGKPYSICMQLPFISQYCNPREVRVQGPQTVTIPVSGGVGIEHSTPGTLYAGEDPYEYTFTFRNYYSVPITFTLKPSIISEYATKIKFNIPETIFKQRINELNKSQFYQDGVFIDPRQLEAEPVQGCPYLNWQINKTQNIPLEQVECAKNKPCNDSSKACVKLDYMECKCAGWAEATCSGAPLYVETEVEHTGYFVGVANIYYSSINAPPQPAYTLLQGPLSLTVEFIPNPYIGWMYYVRNETSMYVTFRNLGGNITITSFEVTPLVTNITTIDKEKEMMLIETIGVEKKWCRDDLAGKNLPFGSEVGMLLCKLSVPFVNTTLIDLRENRTIELNNVTFDRVLYYCNKIRAPQKNYWNTVEWYKEGDVIEVPGNFTIRIGRISIEEVTDSVPTKWSVEINVTLPSGASTFKNYTSNEQFKEEGLEFIVEAFLERPTILGTRERLVQLNITANISIEFSGYTFWSSYWENIYKGIEESGLCELLKKGNETESGIVSNALKSTGVKVEFTYTRKTSFRSESITPYTRTEKCIELANITKEI
jgi:hypothetical protein